MLLDGISRIEPADRRRLDDFADQLMRTLADAAVERRSQKNLGRPDNAGGMNPPR